jgi:alpha-amylase/alpha-mannosidase (GH57 family)
MPHPLYVAFIWHQHQPLYKSATQGDYRLPWVRLHGTKDYLDLVLLLERYPKLHQTVNLVPSLILQLEDYVAGLERFFDANRYRLIEPHPRYAELYEQRQEKGQSWCLQNWQDQDYSDLLAWHNLAWIDPLFWDDSEIAQWLQQGRGFSLSDRQRIYSKQRQILSRILPQHRQMQESGQIEISTTPYTHPILPLLADTDVGRIAVPQMILPQYRFQWREDISRHLRKARQIYRDRFGCEPRGLWSSEQSVSPAILPDVAAQGFQWLCSDEAVLGWSIRHFFRRDEAGTLEEPELLYRPYRLQTSQGDLAIVFRDHTLSDLIGFTYGAMEPKRAATDLVRRLEAIARSLKANQLESGAALQHPWMVTIALDGENCWESYELDGKPFLEYLYDLLSQHPSLQLVTVSEYLDRFPARAILPTDRLHSGSWIDGSFTTWIGDRAKNRAWDLLSVARETLAKHPEATEENNPEAWEALYAAEGSDWFWWLGDGHSSGQDAVFDQLFREHLATLYSALNEPIPIEVRSPIEDHSRLPNQSPQSFIYPAIDGMGDQRNWDNAGRIEIGGAAGTMHRSSTVQRVWYGTNPQNLYLRLDFQSGTKPGNNLASELHLLWFYPDRHMPVSPAPLAELPDQSPLNYLFHHHLGIHLLSHSTWLQSAGAHYQWHSHHSRAQVAFNTCLEIAIPWSDLQLIQPEWSLRLLVVFSDEGRYTSYLPEDALIPLDVP